MSVADFVHAMPKVALHVQLEGAFDKERLLLIAEQNEIADKLKRFDDWVALLDTPDYERLPELISTVSQWLQHPEDLTHVAYELGVTLAKQNVRYAEVHVNPILFTENNWNFEQFMDALNDGRNRAERGWGITMRWVLTIAGDQPRHADEIVRWASGLAGRNQGIVGVSLGDPEDAQPIGQFERAFRAAKKKEVRTGVRAGLKLGLEGVQAALEQLEPSILFDGWGVWDDPDTCTELIENGIPLIIDMKRAICHGLVTDYHNYPMRSLVDSNLTIVLCASMPSYYQTALNAEYLAAVEACGLSTDELVQIALHSVAHSQLPADEKNALIEKFKIEYAELQTEHLIQPASE